MKMLEDIVKYRKESVFDIYTRVVHDFKNYDRITKVKMLNEIYNIYSDYNNIINICTVRELKYLKMVLDDELLKQKNYKDKYDWEIKTLSKKYLIVNYYNDKSEIPEEIENNVKKAIENVNWEECKRLDSINEFLVSYCKMQGSALLHTVKSIGAGITGLSEEYILYHMLNNKLFNYYVYITIKSYDSLGEDIPVVVHEDYYEIEEELDKQREIQGLASSQKIDTKLYKRLFYNDFDLENPKINKLVDQLNSLSLLWFIPIKLIKQYAMLNIERESLKDSIKNIYSLRNIDLTNFFKILDEAMDEMPSGALNGFSPNEARKIKHRIIENEKIREENYVKQQNAHLSSEDAKLFYKIFFALLEFTNNKYKINSHIKIYKHLGINPYEIRDIVEKFWENKDAVILEFCLVNPYKFSKEELEIASDFKKSIRGIFIIAKYELEYTAFMQEDKIYMLKGINDNIDNIISYDLLPYPVITSVIPFKNVLIYDSILSSMNVKMGVNFNNMIDKEYRKLIKYYHL